VFLNGSELKETTHDGRPIVDDSFLLLFNAHFEDLEMRLPNKSFGSEWSVELSTSAPRQAPDELRLQAAATLSVSARSLVVLKRPAADGPPRGAGANNG
jgi:glycogen operon protein